LTRLPQTANEGPGARLHTRIDAAHCRHPGDQPAPDFHEQTAAAYIRLRQIIALTRVEHVQGSGVGERCRREPELEVTNVQALRCVTVSIESPQS
jgi:hypothetical protein